VAVFLSTEQELAEAGGERLELTDSFRALDRVLDAVNPITEALLYASAVRGDFPRLPAGLLALAAPPAKAGDWRVMQASYSATPGSARVTDGCDAYVFTARAASLGVSSHYYGPQDKMVVAQLALAPGGAPPAASPRLAQVTLVQDSFDAPYGMVKTADGSGHAKPTHLKATVAAVQDRGLALVLNDLTMAIEGSARGGPFDCLAANVVLPAGAGVDAVYTESGGRVRNVSRGAPDVPLRLGETVAVRSAGGIVAWRLAFADGHSEIRRWVDPRTCKPVEKNGSWEFDAIQADNPDIRWLHERTTGRP
jgi:hypothetical protein